MDKKLTPANAFSKSLKSDPHYRYEINNRPIGANVYSSYKITLSCSTFSPVFALLRPPLEYLASLQAQSVGTKKQTPTNNRGLFFQEQRMENATYPYRPYRPYRPYHPCRHRRQRFLLSATLRPWRRSSTSDLRRKLHFVMRNG